MLFIAKRRGRKKRREEGGRRKKKNNKEKKRNFFLFARNTRSADVAVAARSKSLSSLFVAATERDCGWVGGGMGKRRGGRGEFDRFTCQVKTQRPRITRLYFRDMPSVGRYANRGLLSSIDTLSVDRFEVLLLIRQSRGRPEKKSARVSLFGRGDFRFQNKRHEWHKFFNKMVKHVFEYIVTLGVI